MDDITYYYLLSKQKVVNVINNILIKYIGFTNIKIILNGKIKYKSVMCWYFIYIFMTKIINLLMFLRDKMDIRAHKFQVTKITERGEVTVIRESDMLGFGDVNDVLETVEFDNNMLTCVFLTFELVNSNETICLKNLVMKYKDLREMHNHTLRNIFLFNKIRYDDDAVINIKMFKNKKMMVFSIPVLDIENEHVNYFINLDK